MQKFKVLDLFSGMGGFSHGFSIEGFKTTGVDIREEAGISYKELTKGDFILSDLRSDLIDDNGYDIIIGGPPCRPWSSINVTKRRTEHPDYTLISRFLAHISHNRPKLFIMENVPPLSNDPILTDLITSTRKLGYSVDKMKVTYSNFGASVKRTRLIISGIIDSEISGFFWKINSQMRNAKTVRDSIFCLHDKKYNSVPDHVWPNLKTIRRYEEYYKSGKYGWRILKWDEPAPSFGNVMKTYTLHPNSSFERDYLRAISVAEAARIMGFPKGFVFPSNIPMGKRYQMIVDSVSPDFSVALAKVAYNFLNGEIDYVPEQKQYS
ncbi:MAG: DNA cytosine methyltransferase [Thermoplasmatales archaeon]